MYATETEIIELIKAFEDCTLARSEWTHSAHLTVALWYLIHNPLTAADQIRFGIQRYNQAHRIESTPTGGYHETITRFWIRLIELNLDRIHGQVSLLHLTNQLTNLYSNPDVLFEYYSRDVIFSSEARCRWIEPNLKSLTYARL